MTLPVRHATSGASVGNPLQNVPAPLVVVLEKERKHPPILAVLRSFQCRPEFFTSTGDAHQYVTDHPPAVLVVALGMDVGGRVRKAAPAAAPIYLVEAITKCVESARQVHRSPLDEKKFRTLLARALTPGAATEATPKLTKLAATARCLETERLLTAAAERYVSVSMRLRQLQIQERDAYQEMRALQQQKFAHRAAALTYYQTPADLDALLV